MALFKKKSNPGNLQPKQGIDKNGRQYTRMVNVDGDSATQRINRVPSPQIVTQIPEGEHRFDYMETTESILNGIEKSNRVNITPDQLDKVFNIMQRFGTHDDDSYGFRRFIATKENYHEWSERGFGARLTLNLDRNGNIRDINLYSISDYDSDNTYPTFYEGQAEIRSALGIEEYLPYDVKYLAGRYWDAHILPSLGEIPRDGAISLRNNYVQQVSQSPHLVKDIVDELKIQPRDEIANLGTYLNVMGKADQDYTAFLNNVDEGKVAMAEREIGKLGFNRSQSAAIMRKVRDIKKELDRAKRAEKKAASKA